MYGSSDDPSTLSNASGCSLNPSQSTPNCCELSETQFNGAACTTSELLRALNNNGPFVPTNEALFNACIDQLKEYYQTIRVRNFTDDGSRFDEGCSADNWGDDNDNCADGSPDCHYQQISSEVVATPYGNAYRVSQTDETFYPGGEYPRYVCLSTYEQGSDGGPTRCATAAIVDSPKDNTQLSISDWRYGVNQLNSQCNLTSGYDTPICCEKSKFTGSCSASELLRYNDQGILTVQNSTDWNSCIGGLEEYYNQISIRHFADDGARFDEGCGADNRGDGNTDCNNSSTSGRPDDCEYVNVVENDAATPNEFNVGSGYFYKASCSDGTEYGQCNSSQQYCNEGTLIKNCSYCGVGCESGQQCISGKCCEKIGGVYQCVDVINSNASAAE